MNQTCKVCGEPAAGFHFGAFTCEGCKSFFGRSYNNLASISECKNNGKCVIDKKNRTTCKACRLRKCYTVGMSKGGSRYGRRSNWFKIHCLLQEQQQQAVEAAAAAGKSGTAVGFNDMAAAAAAAAQQHLQHQRSSHFTSHMGGLLGYPGYLHEMMPVGGTFHNQSSIMQQSRGSHEAGGAAVSDYPASMPFFMINSLPAAAFHQMPPHLIFPGYHPTAATAAADVYVRNEMQNCRKSIDSSDGSQRWAESVSPIRSRPASRESVRISVDENDANERTTTISTSSNEHQTNRIELLPQKENTPSSQPIIAEERTTFSSPAKTPDDVAETTAVAMAAKIQSLSPVSMCSITAETKSTQDEQDIPMDLSMKTQSSRSSSQSFNTAGEYDLNSEVSEEDVRLQHTITTTTTTTTSNGSLRRKFYDINEQELSNSSYDSNGSSQHDAVKRKKLNETQNNFNTFGNGNNPTSMRGIFVCV